MKQPFLHILANPFLQIVAPRFSEKQDTKIQKRKKSIFHKLFQPIDIASLVFFRIAFGAIMLWEVFRYWHYGWIEKNWITPQFFFAYEGFEWLLPWGEHGMYTHFVFLGMFALFIMLGFLYRISTLCFFLGFTSIFLLDQTTYLNHFYLICLISFLLIFIPAHRSFSLDVRMWPKIRSETIPFWCLYIIAFQIGITYFFGGIAKINPDWLNGFPLKIWLPDKTDFPLIGPFFTEDWMAYFFSYGGLLFDLLIVPFLIWKRTRTVAFVTTLFFHLTNFYLFNIGIFPWFMIAATTLFFQPDWFRRIITRIKIINWSADRVPNLLYPPKKIIAFSLAIYMIVQIIVPLRHFMIPGNVSWTEEGHRFSWHMKLRAKSAQARFIVKDVLCKEHWVIHPTEFLTKRQYTKMADHPRMILQFAHYLAKIWTEKGYDNVEVNAVVQAKLNGRKPQFLIDPTVNLAGVKSSIIPAKWILPLPI